MNKALKREHFTLPTLDDNLHELSDDKVFSKADLAAGYWHAKLDEESSKLTTFQTCFGRFRWIRLPFGLAVSAEIFQRKLLQVFENHQGIICIADDIVIHGKNEEEHDENMKNFIECCERAGVHLNKDKMIMQVDSISFMGYQITKEGLKVDPSKVTAIKHAPASENVGQIRSFLGAVNYLSRFVPHMSEEIQTLHHLLKKDVLWNWSSAQQRAFDNIKNKIAELYNPCIL